MTAPTTAPPRPAVHVTETIPARIIGDLWAASTGPVATPRLAEGVLVHPAHGSAEGTWPLPCTGVEPGPTDSKDGARPGAAWFPPVVVWAADECSTVGNTLERTNALASATLDYDARYRLEAHYINHVLTLPATPDPDGTYTGILETVTAPTIADIHPLVLTLASVEARMRRWGHVGVVHASAVLLDVFERLSMIVREGETLRTPSGNVWAFGAGYDSLDTDTIVGTGPTTIHLDRLDPVVQVGHSQNVVYALHEYIAAVTHTDHAIRGVA